MAPVYWAKVITKASGNSLKSIDITPFGIHYRLDGDGAPLTLVHGVGSWLKSWDGVVAALGSRHRVLRYDLRGHGQSERTPGPYSLAGFVEDLEQLLDYVGIDTTVLAGFSLGGLVAQAFTLAHPERVEKLILISTVAGRTAEEVARVQERAETLASEGASTHLVEAVDRWFTPAFIENHPEILEQRRQRSLQNDPACYAAAYRVLADNDLGEQLDGINVPTLVMTGEHDIGSTPRMARFIASRIPDCRVHILPNLKHSILLEAPGQVAAQIKAFLAE